MGVAMTTRYSNDTANQHYISQVEQRLNARNPKAKHSNQRIYSLSLVDRETFTLAHDSQEGRLISKNLSLRDLFSFDVLPSNARKNYEETFQGYEGTMRNNTVSLLTKLEQGPEDIKEEILAIFVAKFMNFLRNPYSIKKALDTVGGVTRFEPTDPDLLTQFNAVLTGSKPHQDHLCAELGITTDEYRMWLASLFMMLMRPKPQEPNLMELTVKQLFERPSGFPMVCVHRYTCDDADKRCLLSDRGFASPLPDEPHLSFNFNLCSTAFITYLFGSVDDIKLPVAPPPHIIERYKTLGKTVYVHPFVNDFAALARYNQNVVYQCHRTVYSSSRTMHGVNTV
jgi:hypothetical protein